MAADTTIDLQAELPRFAGQVSRVLDDAISAYMTLAGDLLALVDQPPQGEALQAQLKGLRVLGREMGTLLAETNRLIDELAVHTNGAIDQVHDPRPIQPILRGIGESMVLLLTVRELADLATLPLMDPALLERGLQHAGVVAWRQANPAT